MEAAHKRLQRHVEWRRQTLSSGFVSEVSVELALAVHCSGWAGGWPHLLFLAPLSLPHHCSSTALCHCRQPAAQDGIRHHLDGGKALLVPAGAKGRPVLVALARNHVPDSDIQTLERCGTDTMQICLLAGERPAAQPGVHNMQPALLS